MPRTARKLCESSIYHVVLRGVNRRQIFFTEKDHHVFLETVFQKKLKDPFDLFGYCLMSNHIHLLIHEKEVPISAIMRKIGTSYAMWLNREYDRCGHVFQGRFGSECVEDDQYLLTVIRYIHNNPVKAHLVDSTEQYPWSSIHAYLGGREVIPGLTHVDFIFDNINIDRGRATREFSDFMKQSNDDQCLDSETGSRKTDQQALSEMMKITHGMTLENIPSLPMEEQQLILKKICQIEGVTHRQISRMTGISRFILDRF